MRNYGCNQWIFKRTGICGSSYDYMSCLRVQHKTHMDIRSVQTEKNIILSVLLIPGNVDNNDCGTSYILQINTEKHKLNMP